MKFPPARTMKQKIVIIAAVLMFALSAAPDASGQWMKMNSPTIGILCFEVSGSNLFAGTSDSGVILSTDNGVNWLAVDSGLTDSIVQALSTRDGNLFAGTAFGGVFLSTNNAISWEEADSGLFGYLTDNVSAFLVSGNKLFAGTEFGVYISTDNGTTWNGTGDTNTYIRAFAEVGTYLFAASSGIFLGGVIMSTDDGASWNPSNNGLAGSSTIVSNFAVIGTNIFAGTQFGVDLSTDLGSNWTSVNNGLEDIDTPSYVSAIACSGTQLFAATDSGIFLSTNNGASWTSENLGLTDYNVYTLAVGGIYLFAGTDSGVWRRSLLDFGNSFVSPVASIGNSICAYPNPFSQSTTITFSSPESGVGEVTIVNLLGTQVARLFEGELAAGEHTFTWDAGGISPGAYWAIVRMNGRVVQVPIVLKAAE